MGVLHEAQPGDLDQSDDIELPSFLSRVRTGADRIESQCRDRCATAIGRLIRLGALSPRVITDKLVIAKGRSAEDEAYLVGWSPETLYRHSSSNTLSVKNQQS